MPGLAYAVTPDPSPVGAVELSPEKVAAAMLAFFRIAPLWGLSNEQAHVLLGHPARSTFYKWKRGRVSGVPHDTVRRLSYVLGIYKALQILLPQPDDADAWIRKPNAAPLFAGGSALERMLSGNVADLYVVRQYLDAQRGGWA